MSPLLVPLLALLIPIVAILARAVVGPWMALQHRRLDIEQAAGRGDDERTAAELRQLKERVAVLERVITDNTRGLDLTSEIERLRDR